MMGRSAAVRRSRATVEPGVGSARDRPIRSPKLEEDPMKRNTRLKLLAAGVAVGLAAGSGNALAQKRVNWKMQSAFPGNLAHLGTSGVRFSKNLSEASDGRFNIKFFEPGALVPALECFDAASKGSVESCWTTPGYHTGKLGEGVSFFTTVPFGPTFGEFMAWKRHGGGDKLRDEIYGAHGLMAIDSFAIGPETSGWFKNEVKSLDQLKGMKMRFFGLGAQVMQKLGVSTQLLAAADIYQALERGVIDATEFSMPTMDTRLGFHQIAKFNYFPGWHQQVSVSEFLMNKAAWDKLSDQNKAIVEIALGDTAMHTYVESDHAQFAAMAEYQEKHGVKVKRWTDEDLAAMQKAWVEALAEETAK